ncbi:hypothetical protein BOH72_23660 [Mycobacterium sp. WY10]|nr:hypothetical protein BOH72_23660 [Mycobacterium sp. WY10]
MNADDERARMRSQHGYRLTRRRTFSDDDSRGHDCAKRARRTDDARGSGIRIGSGDHDDDIGFGEFIREAGDSAVGVAQRNRTPFPRIRF